MSRRIPLKLVDVFTSLPLGGNPLAVVPDGSPLSSSEMQAVARQLNLSETTFVLPADDPAADYRVRIFTPGAEIPFAGHPTLGTAHALLEGGHAEPRDESRVLHQQTLAGIQVIELGGDTPGPGGPLLTMTVPPPQFDSAPSAERFARALGLAPDDVVGSPVRVAVGVSWNVVEIRSLERLQAIELDSQFHSEIESETGAGTTVFCEGAADPECAVRVRSFVPSLGVPEDPVCGSGNGCVGAYRGRRDAIRSPLVYRAEQGIEVQRDGRVEVRVEPLAPGVAGRESDLRVRVGGRTVTLLDGVLTL